MLNYSTINRVRVTDSVKQVNKLLADGWVLLDICKDRRPVFVVGEEFTFDPQVWMKGAGKP